MTVSFTKIDNALICDRSIDSNTFRVYAYIISLYNEEKEYSFPSIRTMAEKLGISTPTIQKAIKKLKDSGYIVVDQIRSNSNNIMNIYKKLKHLIKDIAPTKKEKIINFKKSFKNINNGSKFKNYNQREYDFNSEENELLGWHD